MSLAGTLIFVVGVHSKSMLSVCLLSSEMVNYT